MTYQKHLTPQNPTRSTPINPTRLRWEPNGQPSWPLQLFLHVTASVSLTLNAHICPANVFQFPAPSSLTLSSSSSLLSSLYSAMFQSPYSSASPPPYKADTVFGTFFDAGDIGEQQPPPPSLLSSSFPSSYFLHRSSSSRSLPLPSTPADPRNFHGFHTEPVRRVFSAGDLQCMNGSISSADASQADLAAGRIGRYSAEERRERIERYRTKRNQRNFHKKITYACRKTLADSRPRVRGRFARNGETEHETEAETESMESGFESWNAFNVNGDKGIAGAGEGVGDRWKQMQAALVNTDEDRSGYDEDLWAGFESVFAMNFSSELS